MEGRAVLDVGCGPITPTISLVHSATVHVVDPLIDFHRECQPFGWEFFSSLSPTGAEELPFESESFDFVYCWNALDHVQDGDRVLGEIARVLLPDGQLLLGCDVRSAPCGGAPHPYKWDVETFEARMLAGFTPVRAPTLLDDSRTPASREGPHPKLLTWVGCLKKNQEL
jgi:SAM-dependent methyltransferase